MIRYLLIVISIVLILVPMAHAENSVDSTSCVSGEMTMIQMNKEVMVMSFDLKAIVLSNNNSELLNNASERCVGVYNRIGDKVMQNGYCTYMYPNKEDTHIIEWNGNSDGGTWKFIFGTGKWQGIKGGGDWATSKRVPSITPTSFQNCRSIKGSYELPQ